MTAMIVSVTISCGSLACRSQKRLPGSRVVQPVQPIPEPSAAASAATDGGAAELIAAGATLRFRSEHPDAVDTYEFRLRVAGGGDLDCILPDLPDDQFRAVFTKAALTTGDGLLAVTQTNPYGRGEDGKYHGEGRPRGYTFEQTTPPFLLSERLGALARKREPMALHFYDFLDDGAPVTVSFVEEHPQEITVNGDKRKVRVALYEGKNFSLEVVSGTRFVRAVSRDDDMFRMELLEVRTR
jgi:hypothetical protein